MSESWCYKVHLVNLFMAGSGLNSFRLLITTWLQYFLFKNKNTRNCSENGKKHGWQSYSTMYMDDNHTVQCRNMDDNHTVQCTWMTIIQYNVHGWQSYSTWNLNIEIIQIYMESYLRNHSDLHGMNILEIIQIYMESEHLRNHSDLHGIWTILEIIQIYMYMDEHLRNHSDLHGIWTLRNHSDLHGIWTS